VRRAFGVGQLPRERVVSIPGGDHHAHGKTVPVPHGGTEPEGPASGEREIRSQIQRESKLQIVPVPVTQIRVDDEPGGNLGMEPHLAVREDPPERDPERDGDEDVIPDPCSHTPHPR
jgi:hypothetical protein